MKYLVIGVTLFCYALLSAQDGAMVAKYLQAYEQATTDSARSHLLWQAAFNSANSDASKGIEYGHLALAIAERINHLKLIGDCKNALGFCLESAGEMDSALVYYSSSILFLEKGNFHCETASVYANIGGLLKKRNNVKAALESFTKAESIQNNCPDIGYHASTLYSIGTCYNSLEDFQRALEYFDRSLTIELERNNIGKQGNVHNGKANAYLGLGDLEKASFEYRQALNCYIKAGNTYHAAYAYEGLSQLFQKQIQLDSAVYYCRKALDIFQEMDVKFDIVYESTLLSSYLIESGKLKEAKDLLLKNIPLTYSENLPYDRAKILRLLSIASEKQADFKKALQYLQQANVLEDSLNLDVQKTELAELAAKYETEKRDKQIALEQAENQKQKAENEKQKQLKYFFLSGAALLVILLLVLIGRYRQNQKATKQLAEKNIQIEKAKQRAEHSERMKQQFLANMSHEIRTPMNAITGLSRLLLDKTHDEKSRAYIRAIHHSGENLNLILNDILDLSKIEAGKIVIENRIFNLHEELKNLEEMYLPKAVAKNLLLKFEIEKEVPQLIAADAVRLSQVLGNLINNAIKFTQAGKVHVLVSKSLFSQVKPSINFVVTDTGIGIEADKLTTIFESFMQANTSDSRHYGGTGLGLTISKNLVTLMGGKLEVSSELGKGSIFSFHIPLIEVANDIEQSYATYANSTESESIDLSRYTHIQPLHILIAEDNEYNYMVTHDTLRKYFTNAHLYHARNGDEVLQHLQEDDYDLVLMDVQMPKKNGYETTIEIRKTNTILPIVGLTASVIRTDLDKCIASGMNAYVMKPFKEAELLDAICNTLQIESRATTVNSHNHVNNDKLFLKFIPEKLNQLRSAANENDITSIKSILHSMRPQLIRNKLNYIAERCMQVENASILNEDITMVITEIINCVQEQVSSISRRHEN